MRSFGIKLLARNAKKVIPIILVTGVCVSIFLIGQTGALGEGIFGNTFNTISSIELWEQDYGSINENTPIAVQQLRVFSAAGGLDGLGLYKGHFRINSSQSRFDFIVGVLFEELGMKTGMLFIFLIILTAFGCYFQGVRAEKYHLAALCFLIAILIGLHTFINLASATGISINLMGFRLGIPIAGLPMPFLSHSGSAILIVFICLALVESVKLTGLEQTLEITPAAPEQTPDLTPAEFEQAPEATPAEPEQAPETTPAEPEQTPETTPVDSEQAPDPLPTDEQTPEPALPNEQTPLPTPVDEQTPVQPPESEECIDARQ